MTNGHGAIATIAMSAIAAAGIALSFYDTRPKLAVKRGPSTVDARRYPHLAKDKFLVGRMHEFSAKYRAIVRRNMRDGVVEELCATIDELLDTVGRGKSGGATLDDMRRAYELEADVGATFDDVEYHLVTCEGHVKEELASDQRRIAFALQGIVHDFVVDISSRLSATCGARSVL